MDEKKNLPARVGRPSKYHERFPAIARMFSADGKTDEEMAYAFGISISTFYQWQLDHPEFSEAIKEGKVFVDAEVEDALLRRASGFVKRQRIVKRDPHGNVKEIVEIHDEVPPDTRAIQYWLNNRKRSKWAHRVEVTQTTEPLPTELNIVGIKTDGGKTD